MRKKELAIDTQEDKNETYAYKFSNRLITQIAKMTYTIKHKIYTNFWLFLSASKNTYIYKIYIKTSIYGKLEKTISIMLLIETY